MTDRNADCIGCGVGEGEAHALGCPYMPRRNMPHLAPGQPQLGADTREHLDTVSARLDRIEAALARVEAALDRGRERVLAALDLTPDAIRPEPGVILRDDGVSGVKGAQETRDAQHPAHTDVYAAREELTQRASVAWSEQSDPKTWKPNAKPVDTSAESLAREHGIFPPRRKRRKWWPFGA